MSDTTQTVKAQDLRHTDTLADGTTIARITRKTKVNLSGWGTDGATVTRIYRNDQPVKIKPRS